MKYKLVLSILLLVGIFLAACVAPTAVESATDEAADTVLKITGPATEVSFTVDDISAMEQTEVEYTGNDGVTIKYTGVSPSQLLPEVSDANTITLIAADGYSTETSGTELLYSELIFVFREDGGLGWVILDSSGKLQVKDLVEINIR